MDVARLPFLAEGLRTRIATLSGYPVLTRASESTVPGLYFTGALAAFGIGPSMRFIAGPTMPQSNSPGRWLAAPR